MTDHIDKDAQIKTDCWSGYKGMEAHFPRLTREKSGKIFQADASGNYDVQSMAERNSSFREGSSTLH